MEAILKFLVGRDSSFHLRIEDYGNIHIDEIMKTKITYSK
jgi:hypothetical protein